MREDARSAPLDALRGLIMILMALDHANGFVARRHPAGEFWGGPLPQYDSTLELVVRLVTHLCAPGFFFAMGAGMTIYAASRFARGFSTARVMRHFVGRGLLLVAINLCVENAVWFLGSTTAASLVRGLDPPERLPFAVPGGGPPPFLVTSVLSGLGLCMLVAGLLVRLPSAALLALTLAAVVTTHVATPPPADVRVLYAPLARLLVIPGHTDQWLVVYPVLPWLAAVLPGMVLGRILVRRAGEAHRVALVAGAALLVLFLVVRGLGLPGDLRLPDGEGGAAFLNVVKYPPAFVFLALTLGVDLVLLWALSRIGRPAWLEPVLVFGRTPLFFYLAHLLLFALIGLAIGPAGIGVPAMLPIWIGGVVALYPACRWYDRFKRSTPPDSLWRLF